ncbi:MAG TPA: WbqC family protein [Solirubrobacteraceae bacterium]|nr:WbqC family protein [Solirubrobacteraceae bacterium]
MSSPFSSGSEPGKTVAIIQSNYVPWKGYFDVINAADEFFLYDTVQYTRRDWRNRNRIKTTQGPQWLTIPVQGSRAHRICDAEITDPQWAQRHWRTLSQAYARAPYFAEYREEIETLYMCVQERTLSAVNERFIRALCGLLEITTPIARTADDGAHETKTERLVAMCVEAGATEYLCGPASRDYIEEWRFDEAGIALAYVDYSGYPEYPQLFGPFLHEVTVLDLIFNTGPAARSYMKS